MQKRENFLDKSCKHNLHAQVTIFVIIALVIVAGVLGYFLLRDRIFPSQVPSNMRPIYDKYLSCVQTAARDGSRILGSQAGYIAQPAFEPGSTYAPFSNQLDFMGNGVPYWYYISGNGIAKEQIPTIDSMQKQLADYITSRINSICDFSEFTSRGFNITLADSSKSSASASIKDTSILLTLNQEITINYGGEAISVSSHSTSIDSSLGSLYSSAKKIYDYEQSTMFLENYARDALYNYAPVEGMTLNCSPAVWSPYTVANQVKNALSANVGLIKVNGDSYLSKNTYTDYFIVGKNNNQLKLIGQQASFLYSTNWPSRFEVWPTENNVMIANPIGTQPGLNAMGFCYTPYKFVYDLYFPVLIQVYDPNDASQIFQLPVAVVISKNAVRHAEASQAYNPPAESVCDKANQDITVRTYSATLEPVEADIKLSCFNDECDLGMTKIDNSTNTSSLSVKAPQCLNGQLTASAGGYKTQSQLVSTNEETSFDIIMDMQRSIPLELYVDGKLIGSDTALLTLKEYTADNLSTSAGSVYYPFTKTVSLGAGYYNFDIKVYKGGSITIPSSTTRQCVTMPRDDLSGLFGFTDEQCTDLTVPAQTLTNVLYAGGNTDQYISQSEIANAKTVKVYATSSPLPTRPEDIGVNYDSISQKSIYIELAS